jgi:hypothetical protein
MHRFVTPCAIPSRRTLAPVAFGLAAASLAMSVAPDAAAATYRVGPGGQYAELSDVAKKLAPGDVVELSGDAVYSGGVKLSRPGTADAKITIRGIRRNGKRPVIRGGDNGIIVSGNHYVLEGLEVTGAGFRGIFHHADDVTIRDTVIHDCKGHGILGADTDSGSLTLDYVEVYHCGQGDRKHQIYIATDEQQYPHSVFRMQHCYVHDGNGGNNVKSRAERNEIYYNWIEGAMYHEIELIGSEEFKEGVAREDSDVVGNVIRKTNTAPAMRIGGDGTASTNGRYRFVNNTVLLVPGAKAVFRLYDGLESVEMSNNVFFAPGGGALAQLVRDVDARWARGHAIIAGQNNWVPGNTNVPAAWSGTLRGADPGFVNAGARNFIPTANSPLRNAGTSSPTGPAEAPFPRPLGLPSSTPPPGMLQAPGTAQARTQDGRIDIGAYEAGMSMRFAAEEGEEDLAQAEDALTAEESDGTEDTDAQAPGLACSAAAPGLPGGPGSLAAVGAMLAGLVALRRRR